MHKKTVRTAAAVAFAFLIPAAALAAGLDTPDIGAKALGMGAADFAAPDSLTAIYFNPAGLATQPGFRFLVDARDMFNQVSFQRASQGATTFNPVSNSGAPLIAPALGLSYGWRWFIPFTIAFGFTPPSAYSGDRYPNYFSIRPTLGADTTNNGVAASQTPQRYQLIAQSTQGFVLDLSVAAQFLSILSLGAQLQMPIYNFATTQSIYLNSSAGENAGFDGLLSINAKNPVQFTGMFGASVNLPFGLKLGGSFQLPTNIDAAGTMNITVPSYSSLNGVVSIAGDSANLMVHLPWVARVGIRLDKPLYAIELAGTYEAWSMYKDIVLQPHNISITETMPVAGKPPNVTVNALPTITIPTGMTDAESIRLGGELRPGGLLPLLGWLKIRAGLIYETSAVPLDFTNVTETNWDRFIPTVGLGAALGPIDVDLAYAHVFQADRTVTGGQVVVSPIVPGSPATNNGDYSVVIDMLALSVGGHFG